MAHAVPSQVRELIDTLFPALEREPGPVIQVNAAGARAVLDMVDRIPAELIQLPATESALFYANVSALRSAWEDRDRDRVVVLALPGSGNALLEIQRLLARCPDQAPSPGTTELEFLSADPQLRQMLRTDVSSATSSLMNHEYKEATVIAGSIVEALLLWGFERCGESTVRANALSAPNTPLEQWTLGAMIEAARACAPITEDTKKQAQLAQTFRNLIHPGRQKRLGELCDRGTALAPLAAVERVVSDLERRH